jgi:hypothetical protein
LRTTAAILANLVPFFNNFLFSFALSKRKKSWKSRGNGIIMVGTLAQQFQPFKPFHRRLPQPVAQLAVVIAQIHDGNDFSIHTRSLCQWRFHKGKNSKSRCKRKAGFEISLTMGAAAVLSLPTSVITPD